MAGITHGNDSFAEQFELCSFPGKECFMSAIRNMIAGIGLGAGLVYFFDPKSGRRRRALIRDQIVHAMNKLGDRGEAKLRDLRNRAVGTVAELRGSLRRANKSGEEDFEGGRSIANPSFQIAEHR